MNRCYFSPIYNYSKMLYSICESGLKSNIMDPKRLILNSVYKGIRDSVLGEPNTEHRMPFFSSIKTRQYFKPG